MDVGRLAGGHDGGTVLASNGVGVGVGVGYLDRPRHLLSGRGRRVGLYTIRTRPADSSRSIDAGPASRVAVSRPYRAGRACMHAHQLACSPDDDDEPGLLAAAAPPATGRPAIHACTYNPGRSTIREIMHACMPMLRADPHT